MTCTLGIDLASQPADTAACVIDWGERRLAPVGEFVGKERLTDNVLLRLIGEERITKVGIDAPLGTMGTVGTLRDGSAAPGRRLGAERSSVQI
jgi:hypothetical protein